MADSVYLYIISNRSVLVRKRRKQFEREEKVLRKTVPLGGITMIEKLNIERNRRVKELQLYSVFLLQIVLFQVVIYGYYPVKITL